RGRGRIALLRRRFALGRRLGFTLGIRFAWMPIRFLGIAGGLVAFTSGLAGVLLRTILFLRRTRVLLRTLLIVRSFVFLLRLLAFQPILDRLLVGGGVFQARIYFKGTRIGVDGLFVSALAREGIALVVKRLRPGSAGKCPGRGRVVACAIGGTATPLGIAGRRLRAFRVTGGQCLGSLLIRSLPQIDPFHRLGRRNRRQQGQWKQHQPAPPKSEQGQRQEQKHQPRAAIQIAFARNRIAFAG